jgi:small subunit ribosomal protein S4
MENKKSKILTKSPYIPGQKIKRQQRPLSEYGKQLREKQKLKNSYYLKERQFKRYVQEALRARGKVEDASVLLIQALESRLDNVIFRLGFAPSRISARQIVSHKHILVNNKSVNIPSFLTKKGDLITIKSSSFKKGIFSNLSSILKKHNPPTWLKLSVEKLEGKILEAPKTEESISSAEISSIFEFYSR